LEILPTAQKILWTELSAVPTEFVLYGGTALALHLGHRDSVKVSFSGLPNLPRLMPAHVVENNGLQIASLIDLAGTKASVVQMRAEAKDYIDIDALLRIGKVDLATGLAAAQKLYGTSFNPEITLKALSYFDDGDLRTLPEEMKSRLATAAREVDLERLPGLERAASRRDLDHGPEL
jgi:Nucleotidyl transferase AbiEii toxin, Type IV TA system